MFVGHGLLAFALLVAVGRVADWPRERTLELAVLAAAFATLPDVDIVYAPVGLLGAHSGVFDAASAFWQSATVVHRVLTHSLVVAPVVALAATLWVVRPSADAAFGRRLARLAALSLLAGLVAVTTAISGGLAGVIMTIFGLGALAIATVAARRDVGPVPLGAVALVALLSHPFGDVFTGEPPAFLYPFDVTLLADRVTLHPDPTLQLLAAFFIELAVIWLAVVAYHDLQDQRLRDSVAPRASLGLGYTVAALVVPAPTLASSYQFVFTVLAVGAVGPVQLGRRTVTGRRVTDATTDRAPWSTTSARFCDVLTAVVTGLTAVTLAAIGYTFVYGLL